MAVVNAANTYDRFGNKTYDGRFVIGQSKWSLAWETIEGKIDEFRIYEYALSQNEVMSLAALSSGEFQPDSPANLVVDGRINFKDYAVIANDWLDEQLYP